MMEDFKFTLPQRRKRVRISCNGVLPVPIEACTGIPAVADNWSYYAGQLLGSTVLVSHPGDIEALYTMGFFGKGTLSRHAPLVCENIRSFRQRNRKDMLHPPPSERHQHLVPHLHSTANDPELSQPTQDTPSSSDSKSEQGTTTVTEHLKTEPGLTSVTQDDNVHTSCCVKSNALSDWPVADPCDDPWANPSQEVAAADFWGVAMDTESVKEIQQSQLSSATQEDIVQSTSQKEASDFWQVAVDTESESKLKRTQKSSATQGDIVQSTSREKDHGENVTNGNEQEQNVKRVRMDICCEGDQSEHKTAVDDIKDALLLHHSPVSVKGPGSQLPEETEEGDVNQPEEDDEEDDQHIDDEEDDQHIDDEEDDDKDDPIHQLNRLRNIEQLILSFEEAFFLSYGLGCLIIRDEFGNLLDIKALWQIFCARRSNFIHSYAVYHHLRRKGWVPRTGLKYGADYTLYKDGPAFCHASYCVRVLPVQAPDLQPIPGSLGYFRNWCDLARQQRITEQVKKDLLLCYVIYPHDIINQDLESPSCLSRLKIQDVIVRRWVSSHERDDAEDDR